MPETTLDFKNIAEDPALAALGAKAGVTPEQRFGEILGSILGAVMTFSLIILLLYLVWGAVEWITSAGEKGKLEAARNKMLHAGIGIIVLSSVISLFMLVQYMLGVTVFTFSFPQVGTTGPNVGPTDPSPTYSYTCYQNSNTCLSGEITNVTSCGVSCAQNAVCCRVQTN